MQCCWRSARPLERSILEREMESFAIRNNVERSVSVRTRWRSSSVTSGELCTTLLSKS
jgi:hypothetical protein